MKTAVYEQIARIGQAVASAPRLMLLELLRQSPRTVEALARESGLSVANASQHLKVLRQAQLVHAEKDGVFVTYRLAGDKVDAFCRVIREIAEARLLELQQIARTFDQERGHEVVDRRRLLGRIRRREVTVIDVRPVEEYRAGHIPGAVSIPLADLEARLASLPRAREIVAYCRGPYCVMAPKAVKALRARGYKAVALADGVAEWRAHGLRVRSGDAA